MQCPKCGGKWAPEGFCLDCEHSLNRNRKINGMDRCENCGMPTRKVVYKDGPKDEEHYYCYGCITKIRADKSRFYVNGAEGAWADKVSPTVIKERLKAQGDYLKAAFNKLPLPNYPIEAAPDLQAASDKLTKEYADSDTQDDFNTWCKNKFLRKHGRTMAKWVEQNADKE